jgi:FkbM family methyltransferase
MRCDLLETPSGLLYLAPATDQFIASLPMASADQASAARRRIAGRASVDSVRTIADTTHVPLIASLRRHFATAHPRWEVFDIGGFAGTTAIPLERWIANDGLEHAVRIRVFEPSIMAECLSINISLNGCGDSIALISKAVSSAVGDAAFLSPLGREISSSIAFEGAQGSNSVRTTTIDVEINPEADLLFCKIDTEGHEPEVISGGLESIGGIPTILAIEYHPWRNDTTVAGMPYPNFLFSRFHIWDIGNYGYPSRWARIEDGDRDALIVAATRGGDSLTDILCVDRRLDYDAVVAALDEARAEIGT